MSLRTLYLLVGFVLGGLAGIAGSTTRPDLGGFAEADTVHARVADYYSSWGLGIAWEDPTLDVSSAVFPSTADSAIGVAAYGGRHDLPDFDGSRAGELRNYSGRGPRIDGAPVVDIAASDDPYAAMAATAIRLSRNGTLSRNSRLPSLV